MLASVVMIHDEWVGVAQAVAATLCFSTGAVLVRWAGDLSPVEVTSLRLLLAAVFVGAAARAAGERLRLAAAAWARLAPIGLVAAGHFLSFIASLYYTTVAHALTLTYTAPLFIAALSWLVLKEPLPRRALPGAAVALIGVGVLAGFEPRLDRRMLVGDALAVVAAVTFALYSLLGRRERGRLPLLTYAAGVYLVAGLVTSPFAASLVRPTLPGHALVAVCAMALVPSALGHTLYNAAIRRLHPSLPNLIATQEVTLGILLAWLLVGEPLTWNAIAGAALTLIGVGLVLR
jgi:drug/metabolite transporter (DMT)-like permease